MASAQQRCDQMQQVSGLLQNTIGDMAGETLGVKTETVSVKGAIDVLRGKEASLNATSRTTWETKRADSTHLKRTRESSRASCAGRAA